MRPRRFPIRPIDAGVDACCCNCKWHRPDHSHPCTDGRSMQEQRGWICIAPEFDVSFSGWSEHGLCEMWDPA